MWNIPKIWTDSECWIIGGGPSIIEQFNIPAEVVHKVHMHEVGIDAYSPYLKDIHNKHVIGVNVAFLLGSWIDVLFFGDNGFFLQNIKEIEKFHNLKVTCNPRKHNLAWHYESVKYIRRESIDGISTKKNSICWNKNSGAAAINLAAHFGVKRIILVGFDMSLDAADNRHWHKQYTNTANRKQPRKLPFERHLKGFPKIASDAKKLGIEIINASPKSAITVFEKKPIKDLL